MRLDRQAVKADLKQPWVTADGDDPDLLNHLGGEQARNYRRYEFDTVAPHVGESMLEVGSGLGHFAAQFRDRVRRLVLSDADPYCVEQLAKRWPDDPAVSVVHLALPDVPSIEPVDTVVAMNVLEHIQDDVKALQQLSSITLPNGRIVIWVPGYMSLYGEFDRKVGHVTRYTPQTLRACVLAAGLRPEVLKPVNLLGGIAWWFAVRMGGAAYPNPRLVNTYDRVVVPLTRGIERVVRPPFGQTIFCVARVPG